LSAVLKRAGYEVEVFDSSCEGYDNVEKKGRYVTYGSSEENIKKRVRDAAADIIAVSCMFTAREADTLRVCRYVKELDVDLPVLVGGLHPSLFPEKMLNSNVVDFIVIGEGERKILELINGLNAGKSHFDFNGIAYKNKDEIIINPASGYITDLDSIPYPDRSLIDMEKYIEIGVPFAPYAIEKRVAQILATRGCYNKCNFCSSVNFWGRKIRARSVDNIIGELNLLKEEYGIKEVQFVDDNLTANKKLAKELFTKMKKLNLKWCTPNGIMFRTIDKEMLSLMAESGAYQLSLAIESGSQRVLSEIIHKDVQLDMVKDIVDEAHKYDISIHGMFILGFPGETKKEVYDTLDYPFKIGFDSVSFFIVSPLPGSELYGECIRKKYIDKTFSIMDFKTAQINIPIDSPDYNINRKELEKLADEKTREYNEYAEKLFPKRNKRKFERFLEDHHEHAETIKGRVT
ncbi:B12-binding domain-containing radical SAM protein, partial [Elusimicrobiota bacterium]